MAQQLNHQEVQVMGD
uniref:Uncharacterized protein n=1 Tax=Arundo donax TaxID=35708 RepID=A0A0A9AKA6_ARUDO